jgi:hypothetical protein
MGHPGSPPAGQDHAPPRQVQLLGDLAAGLSAADDEHGPVGERAGIAVLRAVHDGQPPRQLLSSARHVRGLVGAGRHDDGASGDRPSPGLEEPRPGRRPGHRTNVDPAAHRDSEGLAIRLQVLHDVVPRQEAAGIGAGVRAPGKPDRAVWRDQAEAVPAPCPGRTDTVALQDGVLRASLSQRIAGGEASLSSTDHDNIDFLHQELLGSLSVPWADAPEPISRCEVDHTTPAGAPVDRDHDCD